MLLKYTCLRNGLLLSRVILAATASLIGAPCFPYVQAQDTTGDMDRLLQQQRYVEMEHALATTAADLPSSDLMFFKGVMANRTNQGQKSIHLLEALLPALLASNAARAEVALCTLGDDYAKSFRYKDASNAYAAASRVARQQSRGSGCGADREASRWALLSGAAAQTVSGARAFSVAGKRDALGLYQVPVTARNYTGSWLVDSGATLSVISRSAAYAMGLELSPTTETAEGAAAPSVSVHTAVIPEMRLGKAVLRNIAVLVVEDSDLNFPKIGYRIEGSLGLPVLNALGRVTFNPGGHLRFSRAKETDKQADSHNLFLEKSVLLTTADFGHGSHLFALDTGALLTVLSAQFYREEGASLGTGDWASLELEGAGGTIVSPAYILRGVVANLGGGCAMVQNIPMLTESTGLSDEFYGNIGQSALNSFSSVTVDFDTMRFSVAGGKVDRCHINE